MAYKYIIASGNGTLFTGRVNKIKITVNTALTGTITVADGGTTIAIITNPTVGSFYEYWDLSTSVQINPSTTCDITVNMDTSHQGK